MIYNEDAVKWANEYTGEKFHALLCDAPYHLTSIVKRFGKKNSAPAQFGMDGVFSRSSKGFMGQTWDGGDVAFRPETWEAFGKVLYDGAFGMAFSASRNWHRMAVAIEDAGFIIHPTMFFLWINGQGFPKATNISKQLPGNQIPTGKKRHRNVKPYDDENGWNANNTTGDFEYTVSDNPMAQAWDGHRYGLQALKPAVEPIIIFQKPYEGRPIDNIFATGAGALNIEDARVPTNGEGVIINRFTDGAKPWGNGVGHEFETEVTQQGRWPANFVLDEESARRLDEQTGTLQSGKMTPNHKRHTDSSPNGIYGTFDVNSPLKETIGDSGGASRFFNKVSAILDETDPFLYCGKVMPKERNAGMDGEKNDHPTLKPIELSKHLATLLLPPNEYAPRRLFIPFSGSGSEMIGAYLAGWEEVVGVEFDTENGYVDIAKKRIQHWTGKDE